MTGRKNRRHGRKMRSRTAIDEMEVEEDSISAAESEARSSCWSARLWMFGRVDDDDVVKVI